jgi:iron(III) transport system ATP-binding protein
MIPVSVHGVSKSYAQGARVLDALSLEIAAGEVFFLLGASGCGKTTLLRMIAGFISPDQGEIRFGSEDVTSQAAESRGVGMVFQNYALWPHLTVGENIAFGLAVRKVAAPEQRVRVDEALALVELGGLAGRRIAELSGGQQQRVALARALVIRPRVLLLDEPLSNLDARLRVAMRASIRRVCKEAGVTAIYVTHDQQEALSTGDRIAVLVAGKVSQAGTPRELYERPANRTVAAFIGEANLLPGTVAGPDSVLTALGTLRSLGMPAGLAAGAAVTVCLRPERVLLGARLPVDAPGNRFSARITGQSYLGDSARWTLRCGDAELSASESAPPERPLGSEASCFVAAADTVVLLP